MNEHIKMYLWYPLVVKYTPILLTMITQSDHNTYIPSFGLINITGRPLAVLHMSLFINNNICVYSYIHGSIHMYT
jgi:hypothetical protein